MAGRTTQVSVRSAPSTPAQQRNITAFELWADDVARRAWTVTMRATVPQPSVGAVRDAYLVTAFVDVAVAQATTGKRRQRIPVAVYLDGTGGLPGKAPAGWSVRDVRVGGRATYIRAYTDPLVMRGSAVDVVAPASSRVLAAALGAQAERDLPGLLLRRGASGGPRTTTLWMVDDAAHALSVLGDGAPAETMEARRGTPHEFAWVTADGDIAFDLERALRAPPGERRAELYRELTKFVLRDLSTVAPPVLVEGIAAREVRRAGGAAGAAAAPGDLAPLAAAYRRGDVSLASLLKAEPGGMLAPDTSPALRRNAFLTAEATVGWIEARYGAAAFARFVTQLRDEVPLERALRNVLRIDIATLERGVAAWTLDQAGAAVPPPAQTKDDVQGGEAAATITPAPAIR